MHLEISRRGSMPISAASGIPSIRETVSPHWQCPHARGRDAEDVAIESIFGPNTLRSFRVWTDEISGEA